MCVKVQGCCLIKGPVCSYSGGKPGESLHLIVHEQLRLWSPQLFKHMQEEVPDVDVHHLPVIHKLHLERMETYFKKPPGRQCASLQAQMAHDICCKVTKWAYPNF